MADLPIQSLEIAIVCHDVDVDTLERVLGSIERAIETAAAEGLLGKRKLHLVDNGPDAVSSARLQDFVAAWMSGSGRRLREISILGSGQNLGYGAGNNLAIKSTGADVFLVLNPDVVLNELALVSGLRYLAEQPGVGLVAPVVYDRKGRRVYLCKRFPNVLDLLLRGFAPARLKLMFDDRLATYEMRDLSDSEPFHGVPIISGAFMLCRSSVLQRLGGFDENFFLYFEDFDLSLRAAELCEIAFVPSIRIEHFGGEAARKGWRHRRLFARSAFTFFQRHGWRWR